MVETWQSTMDGSCKKTSTNSLTQGQKMTQVWREWRPRRNQQEWRQDGEGDLWKEGSLYSRDQCGTGDQEIYSYALMPWENKDLLGNRRGDSGNWIPGGKTTKTNNQGPNHQISQKIKKKRGKKNQTPILQESSRRKSPKTKHQQVEPQLSSKANKEMQIPTPKLP